MNKGTRPYQSPLSSVSLQHPTVTFCAASGNRQFLNAEGTEGNMNYIETGGDASQAASRRFYDEEYDSDW